MIHIKNLYKTYWVGTNRKDVAIDINLEFPSDKAVGLFGRNGAGKSTLLRMISGVEEPDRGEIIKSGSISWPVGFGGSFHPELSGLQNIKFVARLYGVDTEELTACVEDFAELGPHFHAPFRTYSSGMRARLGFGLSMGIKFDTYLIDEVAAVGDEAFRKKSSNILKSRIGESSAIIVSHSMSLMKELCDIGVLIVNGRAKAFEDIDEAIEQHKTAMSGQIPEWTQN